MNKLMAQICATLKRETLPKISYRNLKNKNCGGGYFVYKLSENESKLHIVEFKNEIDNEISNEHVSKILDKLVLKIMDNSFVFVCTMLSNQKNPHKNSYGGHYDYKKVPCKLTIKKLSGGGFTADVEYKTYCSYSGRFFKSYKSSFNFDLFLNINHKLTI